MATELEQRIRDANISADEFTWRLKIPSARVARVIYDGELGENHDRIVAALDDWEKNGLPPIKDPYLEPKQTLAEFIEEVAELPFDQVQERIRKSGGLSHDQLQVLADRSTSLMTTYREARDKDIAERNAALKQKHIDAATTRAELAEELKRLRAITGLTQRELGAYLGIDWRTLSRMETAGPVGVGTSSGSVLLAYQAAAKLRGGPA